MENTAVQKLLQRDLGMKFDTPQTEVDLLEQIANRVAYLLEYELEFLMSLMYRLDVQQSKVEAALNQPSETPVNVILAKLLLDRQLERLATKQTYQQDQLDDIAENLKW